jgi:hypothetical protein
MTATSTHPTRSSQARSSQAASTGRRPRNGGVVSVAAQVKAQRRGYARAVVRSLARAQCGQPVGQIQQVLRSALTPLGVRLSPTALRELATGIAAGTPVDLP